MKTVKTTAKAVAPTPTTETKLTEKKPAERKLTEKKPVENKIEEKKPVEKKTAVAKKEPVKKPVLKETVYLQYAGKEISSQEIQKEVKEYWTKTLKNKVGDIKSLTIYLKPEENAAYFVINDDVTGSIEL